MLPTFATSENCARCFFSMYAFVGDRRSLSVARVQVSDPLSVVSERVHVGCRGARCGAGRRQAGVVGCGCNGRTAEGERYLVQADIFVQSRSNLARKAEVEQLFFLSGLCCRSWHRLGRPSASLMRHLRSLLCASHRSRRVPNALTTRSVPMQSTTCSLTAHVR